MNNIYFISVFILLSMNFICYGNSNAISDLWNSVANGLFGKNDGLRSSEDGDWTRLKTINQYWLYTRDNPFNGQQLIINNTKSILSSNMKNTRVTLFIIHGWLGYYTDDMNVNITTASLQSNDLNVVCIDWSIYSKATYMTSVNSVPKVGTDVGNFINWLIDLGYSYDKIHIAGHSLGAHVAGYAGRRANGRIRRITGLDPAGPAWNTRKILSPNDAQYVECIHTSAKIFGTDKLCGHADFFPNGGIFMPGCGIDMGCSHMRAFFYFAATIAYQQKFVASKCNSVQDAMECSCKGEKALMGNNDMNKKIFGIYCLKTKDNYPYF